MLTQVKDHLCKDQTDCEIVSEIPFCEESSNDPELEEQPAVSMLLPNNTFYNIVKREINSNPIVPKRKMTRTKSQLRISVYTKLSKKLGLWQQNTTKSENIKRVKQELRTLPTNDNLKNKLLHLKINLNVLRLDHLIRCEKGSVSKKFICVMCPSGTFQNANTSTCQPCPIGTYNGLPGQTRCTVCPLNYSTRKLSSRTVEDCKEQCQPGTIARKKQNDRYSLKPYCRKCIHGEYQPFYNKIYCEKCPDGLTSSRASVNIESCYPKRQQHCKKYPPVCGDHGKCTSDINTNLYSCSCDDGYGGSHCEYQMDVCLSMPCINGGVCSARNNTFHCECSNQFKGDYCENVNDPCSDTYCKNGGNCIEINEQPYCECESGFTGANCEREIDYCENSPCENGQCVNRPNGFYCECSSGFIGRRCHLKPCDYLPCSSNAICIDLMVNAATRNSFR